MVLPAREIGDRDALCDEPVDEVWGGMHVVLASQVAQLAVASVTPAVHTSVVRQHRGVEATASNHQHRLAEIDACGHHAAFLAEGVQTKLTVVAGTPCTRKTHTAEKHTGTWSMSIEEHETAVVARRRAEKEKAAASESEERHARSEVSTYRCRARCPSVLLPHPTTMLQFRLLLLLLLPLMSVLQC
jgi:hypothetical protein